MRIIHKRLYFFGITCLFSIQLIAQQPEFFNQMKNSTVLIYKEQGGHLQTFGTGFTYLNYDTTSDENILVTCRHLSFNTKLYFSAPIPDSLKSILPQGWQTINSPSGKFLVLNDGNNYIIPVELKLDSNLFRHPDLDIAVIYFRIPGTFKGPSGKVYTNITTLQALWTTYFIEPNQVYAGQEVVFMGFPFGIGSAPGFQASALYSDVTSNPLVRKGLVSWVSKQNSELLLDGFSYGGNSGSPVFSVPTWENAHFIGMVIGHLPDDQEVQFDKELLVYDRNKNKIDTLKPTVNISVNNGLARCIPAYIIKRFLNEVEIKKKKMSLKQK